MKNHLETAIAAAIEAGKAIMQIYATEFSVDFKSDSTPLTKADTKADSLITQRSSKPDCPSLVKKDDRLRILCVKTGTNTGW